MTHVQRSTGRRLLLKFWEFAVRNFIVFLACVSGLFISGCKPFEIVQSNPDGDAIPIPEMVPHVLMVKKETPQKGGAAPIVEWVSSWVYLPADKPAYYVRPKGSTGPVSLELEFGADGRMTKLGGSSDGKLAETITALGSFNPFNLGAVAGGGGAAGPDTYLFKYDPTQSPPFKKVYP